MSLRSSITCKCQRIASSTLIFFKLNTRMSHKLRCVQPTTNAAAHVLPIYATRYSAIQQRSGGCGVAYTCFGLTFPMRSKITGRPACAQTKAADLFAGALSPPGEISRGSRAVALSHL